ncbi:hypothetical protein LAZ67_3000888 [Cordylochernes scorpioides]|uniref:Transposase n=1 Tax=Cordylochernes scorpioides TaxID=51811 RepID=A0ABY6K7F9_9ARAC|nr:hypothetical protein LAZ67_3000888 [Cordylochernes scorpioides]
MKITDSTHFAHYKFLSESFMTEEYLRINISLPKQKTSCNLWQFFREERKDFWKENGRNCLLCMDLMDDNLVHYFFQCPLLTEKCTEIFPSPTSGQFRYHRICQLLSSALNDELLIVRYFKFCTEAGRMRTNAGQRILENELSVNSPRCRYSCIKNRINTRDVEQRHCKVKLKLTRNQKCEGVTQSATIAHHHNTFSCQVIDMKAHKIMFLVKCYKNKHSNLSWFEASKVLVHQMVGLKALEVETGDVKEATIENWKASLIKICNGYSPKDIFNLDETGLSTRQYKKKRSKIVKREGGSIVLLTNVLGEKEKPIVIGKAKNPRTGFNFLLDEPDEFERYNEERNLETMAQEMFGCTLKPLREFEEEGIFESDNQIDWEMDHLN